VSCGNGVPGEKLRCAFGWPAGWPPRFIMMGFARVAGFAKGLVFWCLQENRHQTGRANGWNRLPDNFECSRG